MMQLSLGTNVFLLLLVSGMNYISQNIQNQISTSTEEVLRKYSPKRIFIFGSQATNNARSDSDLDLCITLNLKGQRKIDLIRMIRHELIKSMDYPLDILIYDNEEFDERAKYKSSFEYKISKQGILING
jgi:predicted nucleotidyltransferase